MRSSGTSAHYYHYDELGSTRLLTNATGAVTDTYTYDAYGSLITHNRTTGSVDQPYQYVGRLGYYTHHQSPDFRWLELGVRFYQPDEGRFERRDPIVKYVYSAYGYADQLPTAMIDADGRFPVLTLILGGVAIAEAICLLNGFNKGDIYRDRTDNPLNMPSHFMSHCVAACEISKCFSWNCDITSQAIRIRMIQGVIAWVAWVLLEVYQASPWGHDDAPGWANDAWLVGIARNTIGVTCGQVPFSSCFSCCRLHESKMSGIL